ncbi:hypothetical protein [Microcoleus sp. herbarium12]|uniref:hypothetical protein n=1 Tax=Microcoleus sp. herbarium12 TaxID=3055437 RepID=UPI002FD1C0E0
MSNIVNPGELDPTAQINEESIAITVLPQQNGRCVRISGCISFWQGRSISAHNL